MDRRWFLQGILAAVAAPAIVRADSLMRIVPREATVITPVSIINTALGVLNDNGMHWLEGHQWTAAEMAQMATITIRRPARFRAFLTHA